MAGGGSAATTDAEGRVTLDGLDSGKAVVVFEKAGFRLRGRVIDPSAGKDMGTLTAIRDGDDPGPAMKPLADPIPAAESRALADRLLAPYLHEDPEKRDSRRRLAAIEVLGEFDINRALDLLQEGHFPDDDQSYQFTRSTLAIIVAATDPAWAAALAEAIPTPEQKIAALAEIVGAIPASEPARKREMLERIAFMLRNDLKRANARMQLRYLTTLARQWLDLGDRDRARAVLEEGKGPLDSLPVAYAMLQGAFLAQLARIEPGQAMDRLRKLPAPRGGSSSMLEDAPAEVAVSLAIDHPEEAERAFHLWKRTGIQWQTVAYVMQIARRLARVDAPRARRFAAAQGSPADRALAWAYVALGLSESRQADAAEAIDRALDEIDRLRESGPGPEQVIVLGDMRLIYPTNPAAVILPVVERASPDRLAEVFWRAVAATPRLDPGSKPQARYSYLGYECLLLARYDREVAAALGRPMAEYLRSLAVQKFPQNEFSAVSVVAEAGLDPRAAVELAESLTPPREFVRNHPVHTARFRLAEILGLPTEKRWKQLWELRRSQIPLDD